MAGCSDRTNAQMLLCFEIVFNLIHEIIISKNNNLIQFSLQKLKKYWVIGLLCIFLVSFLMPNKNTKACDPM